MRSQSSDECARHRYLDLETSREVVADASSVAAESLQRRVPLAAAIGCAALRYSTAWADADRPQAQSATVRRQEDGQPARMVLGRARHRPRRHGPMARGGWRK